MRQKMHHSATNIAQILCVIGLLALLLTSGCAAAAKSRDQIERLRVGVLPGEDREALQTQFSPLVAYLQQELGIACELVLHDSYEELQQAFEDGQLELVWFGGYTFVNVQRSRGAVALVSRDQDLRFTSYFLVRADEAGSDLDDFRGRRFAFGSRLSTSGHLMPRYYLREWEITPEDFFAEIIYSGAHDKTARLVANGTVDIGVASATAIDARIADGTLKDTEIRVLKETPPYVDYVWACQPTISPAVRNRIRDAFLSLDTREPEHAEILQQLRAEFFVPVHGDDFQQLSSIADSSVIASTSKR